MHWRDFFVGKKVTLMGLGLLGRGVGDARILAELGADLIVTDMKKAEDLQSSLDELKGFSNITYRLGCHDLADFKDRDFILKAAGVPIKNVYIDEARKNGIPIKMGASWFLELTGIPSVGVTGTKGKSSVTHLIHDIMSAAGMDAILGGNVRGVSTLGQLPRVTQNSVAILELDSWQLQGFGEDSLSPNIAVFTTFYPDHMNYYKHDMNQYLDDKAQIFLHQKPEDTLIVSTQVLPILKERYVKSIRSKVVVVDASQFPKGWDIQIPGEHNKLNAVCAIEAARALGIDDDVIQQSIATFKAVPGRLEFLREVKGVKIYNDNNATTPEATIASLRAVGSSDKRSVVLVIGGDDKELEMDALLAEIPRWCSKVVLFKERGTDRIRDQVFAMRDSGIEVYEEDGLPNTINRAFSVATPGETLLYSPTFSSFGKYFKNEFDRMDQFIAFVNTL